MIDLVYLAVTAAACLVCGGYLGYKYGRVVEQKAQAAIMAARLTALAGKTAVQQVAQTAKDLGAKVV